MCFLNVGGIISKPQVLMTPCTPSGSDATNWSSRPSALEGMMAQVVATISRSNMSVTPLVRLP